MKTLTVTYALEDEAFEARAFASSEISTLSTGILPTFAVLSSFVAEAATLELLLVVPWSTKTWDEYDVLMVFIEPSPSVFICPQSYIG